MAEVALPSAPDVRRDRWFAVLRGVTVAAGIASLAVCLAVMATRLFYPYEVEWIEGLMVDGVSRVMAGQPLYAAPSLDFTVPIYAPLFFYVSAAVATLVGPGFVAGRVVSVASTLLTFVCIYRVVSRDAQDRAAGLVAVGFVAATYRATGTWFDLARVDSLALVLALGGAFLARSRQSVALVAGACLLALSIHTKQSMVFVAAGCAGYVVWQHARKDAALFLGVLAGVAGLGALAGFAAFGEWYGYYVYLLPMAHEPLPSRLGFWTEDVPGQIPVLALMAALFFLRRPEPRTDSAPGERWRFYGTLLLGAIACSWSTRMNVGAWVNVLIPAYVVFAMVAALALAQLWQDRSYRFSPSVAGLLGAALLVQWGMLGYLPWHQIPTDADRHTSDRFVSALRAMPGDVWVVSHGYIGAMAGKPLHAHWQAVADVLRHRGNPASRVMAEQFASAMRAHKFAAIVTDGWEPLLDTEEFRAHYRRAPLPDGFDSWPASLTGAAGREPRRLFVPR